MADKLRTYVASILARYAWLDRPVVLFNDNGLVHEHTAYFELARRQPDYGATIHQELADGYDEKIYETSDSILDMVFGRQSYDVSLV